MSDITLQIKTLTPIWTGGINRDMDRLHETGIIGSLRWWYEALVRGLGGYACDPTSDDRCVYNEREGERSICAACHLFGCTGWARRFRLEILDEQRQFVSGDITANGLLRLNFIELREISSEERWLLCKSFEIISEHGSLGGKTTLKPQKGIVGKDYGLFRLVGNEHTNLSSTITRELVVNHLLKKKSQSTKGHFPDLRWFFFATGDLLWRREMNQLFGLSDEGKPEPNSSALQIWLRGRRGVGSNAAESKKVFSFQAKRVWGYGQNQFARDEAIQKIKVLKPSLEFKTGEEVISGL